MKFMSVIIPYRNRIEDLIVFAKNIQLVEKKDIEFIMIVMGDDNQEIKQLCKRAGIRYYYVAHNGPFCLGKGHNIGARVSNAKYIMKQDIDCVPYIGLYERLLPFVNSELGKRPKEWLNVAVFYAQRQFTEQFLRNFVTYETYCEIRNKSYNQFMFKMACGNQYIINREHYLSFGGVSDKFIGYGWEDYQVIAYLEKILNPSLNFENETEETITFRIRDSLAREKNKITNAEDLILIHRFHPSYKDDGYRDNLQKNKSVLLKLVNEFKGV
jgi:predicted glycosyltransferase involved in capsule biosynthesis